MICVKFVPRILKNLRQISRSLHPTQTGLSRSHFKSMVVCFFDHKRIVYQEFIRQRQVDNQQYYLEEKNLTNGSLRSLWATFLLKNRAELNQPLYSPGMTPCDFCLLPKLALKDNDFSNKSNRIWDNRSTLFRKMWMMEACSASIDSHGEYFEGDSSR